MRLYRRFSRLKYLRWFHSYDRDLFKWLLGLKPGDLIGACTGLNHVVAEIKPYRRSTSRGWYINEIRVTDTEGRWHWAPGGGCVCRPYSREEIVTSARDFAPMVDALGENGATFWRVILDAEGSDKPFIDDRGLYVGPPRVY